MLPPLDQALTQLNTGPCSDRSTTRDSVTTTAVISAQPDIQKALTRFQEALVAIETRMKNSGVAETYPYLLLSLIPQSINI
jgi:hypothetical protein